MVFKRFGEFLSNSGIILPFHQDPHLANEFFLFFPSSCNIKLMSSIFYIGSFWLLILEILSSKPFFISNTQIFTLNSQNSYLRHLFFFFSFPQSIFLLFTFTILNNSHYCPASTTPLNCIETETNYFLWICSNYINLLAILFLLCWYMFVHIFLGFVGLLTH